jgi:hypothetical protein
VSWVSCPFCGRDVIGSSFCGYCKHSVPPPDPGTHYIVGVWTMATMK